MLILSHVQNNNWNVFSHNRDVCYILAMMLSIACTLPFYTERNKGCSLTPLKILTTLNLNKFQKTPPWESFPPFRYLLRMQYTTCDTFMAYLEVLRMERCQNTNSGVTKHPKGDVSISQLYNSLKPNTPKVSFVRWIGHYWLAFMTPSSAHINYAPEVSIWHM